MSPTLVISTATGLASVGNAVLYAIIGIAMLLAMWPTAHDGGTVPGRILNILDQVAGAVIKVLGIFGAPVSPDVQAAVTKLDSTTVTQTASTTVATANVVVPAAPDVANGLPQ